MGDSTMKQGKITIDMAAALLSLYPEGGRWMLEGNSYSGLIWDDDEREKPTEEAINAEITKLQAESDAQEYARNRQAEYPDTGAQFNKIYDDGVDKWKTEMVDPVKAKWPKDNSGPK